MRLKNKQANKQLPGIMVEGKKKPNSDWHKKQKCLTGSLISQYTGKVGFRLGLIQWFIYRIKDLFLGLSPCSVF